MGPLQRLTYIFSITGILPEFEYKSFTSLQLGSKRDKASSQIHRGWQPGQVRRWLRWCHLQHPLHKHTGLDMHSTRQQRHL